MKKKLFMLLAMVLLSSVSVFAQSGGNEPLKGDVNEDGTVDVADIVAVIDIIKQSGGEGNATGCYYKVYIGKSISDGIPAGSVPESLEDMTHVDISNSSFQVYLGEYGFALYVCLPNDKSFDTDEDGMVKAYDELSNYTLCYIKKLERISPNYNMFKITASSNGYHTRTFKIK